MKPTTYKMKYTLYGLSVCGAMLCAMTGCATPVLKTVKNHEDCAVVRADPKYSKPFIVIDKPGKYCIDRDYHFTCYPGTHSCTGTFINIHSDDVELDMKGHVFSVVNSPTYRGVYASGHNIAVRNGKIRDVGIGVRWQVLDGSSYSTDFFKREPLEGNKLPARGNFLLENLEIVTDKRSGWAIQSSGASIVLKNNTIIGTMMIHGPNAVLEGNRIQLDARAYNPNQRYNFRYGLLARNANNLKIAGNTFGILGDRTETTAIAIWDTQNAVVTDNSIGGAAKPIQIDNSTVEQRNNKTGLW
jgi:hypothetical protein